MSNQQSTPYRIPFNKPFLSGEELEHIRDAVASGKISGNGKYTKACERLLEERYGFGKVLLTTSGTDALEMAAMLCGVGPGDEVIVPSYTFVSTALAFLRQGAEVVFADSGAKHPNLDADTLEELVTERTKVVVPVHYAGQACDMGCIMELAEQRGLRVVEDAAQAVDAHYNGRPLGGIGHLGCFSFHETKNIICGEGGALVVNDEAMRRRAEILWEKGTNRAEFFRGEVNKYGWVDMGSSFLPSEIVAAFLYAQLEHLDRIQAKRRSLWEAYARGLEGVRAAGFLEVPELPPGADNNAHMFFVVCRSLEERTGLIAHLKSRGILSVFHHLCLHKSAYYTKNHPVKRLPNAERFEDCLLRLPMYYELSEGEVADICGEIAAFFDGLR